jgi:hypothetical protein
MDTKKKTKENQLSRFTKFDSKYTVSGDTSLESDLPTGFGCNDDPYSYFFIVSCSKPGSK